MSNLTIHQNSHKEMTIMITQQNKLSSEHAFNEAQQHKDVCMFNTQTRCNENNKTQILNITQSTINPTRKQTEQSFLINTMSSLPWYMHLPYGISLPLQKCTRNKISPPKDMHKSHIEMTKLSSILLQNMLSPFLTRIDKGVKEKIKGKR